MITGSLVLDGVDDSDLSIILRVKEQHEPSLHFEPEQLRPTGAPAGPSYGQPGYLRPAPQPQPAGAVQQTYNNALLEWSDQEGLNAVFEILHRLTPSAPNGPFPPLAA